MKTRMLFSLVILISAFGSIAGQTNAEPRQVTLYNFSGPQRDASRSSINLETGKRGHLRGEPLTEFDLMYGGMVIQKDGKVFPDWFRVLDSRSMIVDLGAKKWPDVKETPPFPKASKSRPPLPLSKRPVVIDVSAASTEVSPYRQVVEVKAGHVYLMRLLHGKKVVYTMFRVESLNSGESCVLSWKQVTPPNVDDEK